MPGKAVVSWVEEEMFPALVAERERLDRIDRWWRWEHDKPHKPNQATPEYNQLGDMAQTPWLSLVVTATAQELQADGYRRAVDDEDLSPWRAWVANGMQSRQIAVHRAALGYGYSYTRVTAGRSTLGQPMPVIRGVSPRRMIAFHRDPAEDDWPAYVLQIEPGKLENRDRLGWIGSMWDDRYAHRLHISAEGKVDYISYDEHNIGVVPFVRYTNQLDLEGRSDGEVEPFIPLVARIDQTVFDRLVIQRFASWVVRTISGMTLPEGADKAAAEKLRLSIEDILVAQDPDTKFGHLPASDVSGPIAAVEAEIQALAAVSQTPAFEMLGQMANLSAEALVAARASLGRKVQERKTTFGQSHGQTLRLTARVMGDHDTAMDMDAEVHWRDMESRSLAQSADALGKFAEMLGVPVEMLWEDIPGWDQSRVERAKRLHDEGDALSELLREMATGEAA